MWAGKKELPTKAMENRGDFMWYKWWLVEDHLDHDFIIYTGFNHQISADTTDN